MNAIPTLQMEAVLLSCIATIAIEVLLPHVLTQPLLCPGGCGEDYVLLLDKPVALEVEVGTQGEAHLALLKVAMSCCRGVKPIPHIRTDGIKVWEIALNEKRPTTG